MYYAMCICIMLILNTFSLNEKPPKRHCEHRAPSFLFSLKIPKNVGCRIFVGKFDFIKNSIVLLVRHF